MGKDKGVFKYLPPSSGQLPATLLDLPYCHDRFPVLAVARPDGYFVSLRSDVDYGAAHVFARLVERLPN